MPFGKGENAKVKEKKNLTGARQKVTLELRIKYMERAKITARNVRQRK
jgi:hypothetical protein